jgi:Fe-S-cluster containining protein
VAVGINAPWRPRYATDILWYLYHQGVSVHRDSDGEWSVVFEARCRNLGAGLLCGIYPHRPHVCRTFDEEKCEVNQPKGARSFHAPGEFLEYLLEKRPRVYRAIRKHIPPGLTPPDSPRTGSGPGPGRASP